jgi:hypothetical protein
MRDLGAVLDRVDPLPEPACDQAQHNMRDGGQDASPVLRFIVAGVGERRRWHRPSYPNCNPDI